MCVSIYILKNSTLSVKNIFCTNFLPFDLKVEVSVLGGGGLEGLENVGFLVFG
jgi:hypothetical protein